MYELVEHVISLHKFIEWWI